MNATNKNVDVIPFNPAPRSGWNMYRRVDLPLGLLCVATPLDHAGYRVKKSPNSPFYMDIHLKIDSAKILSRNHPEKS